ncbi:MAG: hypothetical protein JXR67_09330 [Bacteroidales bacterium]|nr:hypothetical protein [Bacteroidales bacterium]
MPRRDGRTVRLLSVVRKMRGRWGEEKGRRKKRRRGEDGGTKGRRDEGR